MELTDKGFSIKQSTSYPFGNRVSITIDRNSNRAITVALPVPEYMDVIKLSINGKQSKAIVKNGFIHITKKFKSQYRIILDYSLRARLEPLINKTLGNSSLRKAVYGPLVLGANTNIPLSAPKEASLQQFKGEYKFIIEGIADTLTPLYHLLDPEVLQAQKYHREVIFNTAK